MLQSRAWDCLLVGPPETCRALSTLTPAVGASAQVTPLAAAEVEEQLRMAVEEIVRTPAALLQALLDHSHGSYAQELWAAARQLERRAERQAGAAAPGLGAGASSFETLER